MLYGSRIGLSLVSCSATMNEGNLVYHLKSKKQRTFGTISYLYRPLATQELVTYGNILSYITL